ncbi:phosphatidylinositol-specific phospholipase C [Streptomyces sp. HNM0574]|uniref:phosphatidylinositol-specific phospholipase C n=1 Tax=Streptomyces sp. HNM0574 TaxID=2714954 RepID=UPI00146F921C|nr:phosphatidylinositol-specific phospholipase C [Streptomyces sp. HNM0574]NLU66172.1 phosphatidylinositol-specific phospholipase C [Streptomyces sp. HNM0574]
MTIERRTFLRGAAGVAAAGAAATAPAGAAWATGTGRRARQAAPGTENWLSVVPGRTTFPQLTLPGTHDSGARHGGPWAECQNTTIDEQLRAGARFLDIRCRAFDNAFSIHHGPFYQHLNFTDVLTSCRDFLRAHPTETVLMRLKQEFSAEPPEEFRRIFDDYLAQPRWRRLLLIGDRLPSLGTARGRVVLLADDPGLPGVRFGDDALFDVQDDYQVPPHRKFGLIEAQFRRAVEQPGKLFTNFVSTAALLPPRSNADTLNPRVKELLSDGLARGWKGLGIIPMDFPGEHRMYETLIRHNAPLIPRLASVTAAA